MLDRNEAIALIARYAAHWAFATYGLVLFSFLVGLFFELLLRQHYQSVDYLLVGPSFALPAIVGIFGGYYVGKYLPSRISRIIWFPALLILTSQFYFDYKYRLPGSSFWQGIVTTYVGADCSASECLGEVFLTAPLVSAFAYTLGAEVGRLREVRRLNRRNSTKSVSS